MHLTLSDSKKDKEKTKEKIVSLEFILIFEHLK